MPKGLRYLRGAKRQTSVWSVEMIHYCPLFPSEATSQRVLDRFHAAQEIGIQ